MAKKVCLLIDRLASGGAEKMVANLSQSLVDNNYDVTIVIMRDDVKYDFKGQLYNFGKIKASHTKYKAFQLFKAYFKAQKFDIIIDHRVRMHWLKELLFAKFVFRKFRVVYCVHHFDLSLYFPLVSVPFLAKQTLVSNKQIVAVSKMAKEEMSRQLGLNSRVIYNYPIKEDVSEIKLEFKYIIAIGRLEKIKQFDVLIEAYKTSKLPTNNINLLIFGEGSQSDYLQSIITENNLEELVSLKGFDVNVASYLKGAQALVMTSKSEGFPMVLIEAIQHKTPVISFDCKSGPSEIIEHGINGILVEDQKKAEFVAAINKLTDEDFYSKLVDNLEAYNSPFTEENTIQQWIDVIEA
ncbi:glycosyltransferase [Winogradskyella jejuensis]|uniref:N-acetylgalactosamine-N,N'-diacetylbacillosaminyl-diphospho-undecaprenol 4-alpha-N-acetylgalactosaminyltransferase n=1 Tax=Winogradskyella jejuensis TaxID=1089305 RepID=A0A1M5KA08_9FLAO|nr:glycosyltransferase [Winogradskyella jejuensis]SHG49430.1 N-acetylgalactosamine-N,N'-diacetylbacillosaminyl-diphospho-undecaprenol 4-alpha-N-acetylgalactosaminyltransferase [Winogradskyella jejuensis]